MEFLSVDPANASWDRFDAFPDRVFSQRRGWLEFVANTAKGKVVVAELKHGGESVGCFSGIVFHRLGVPILGSPFQGWMTSYMGFNLVPGVSRIDALAALKRFAFEELRCQHLEVMDRSLSLEDLAGLNYEVVTRPTYVSSLEPTEDEIFAAMNSSCRRCIRKSEKVGVSVEEAAPEGFAREYYQQLIEVFSKQGLKPPYSEQYVQDLIDKIHPTGDALLLRALAPDGSKIASAIYFGHKEHALFWGNGSFRSHQILRPNEALHWYAMRYWKRRGVKFFDWSGPNPYKRKYGPELVEVPRILISRHRILRWARDAAYRMYTLPRMLKKQKYQRQLRANGKASQRPAKQSVVVSSDDSQPVKRPGGVTSEERDGCQ